MIKDKQDPILQRLDSYIEDLEALAKKSPSNATLSLYQTIRELKDVRDGNR